MINVSSQDFSYYEFHGVNRAIAMRKPCKSFSKLRE
jgi:hypothetical protein